MTAQHPKIVWTAQAGSQALAMSCPCNEIFLGGTRGSMKTDSQAMKFRQYVGLGYGAFWRGVIFDTQFSALDDLIARTKRWFTQFGDGAKFTSGGSPRWRWPTGEELLFRVMASEKDYDKVHGQEFPFIGHNELTKSPNLELYDMCKTLNRSSFVPHLHSPDTSNPLPEIPRIILSTGNPFGVGHNAVKRRFVDHGAGNVVYNRRTVFNPRTQRDEEMVSTQVYLFCTYRENRFLTPEYIVELESILDPNKRRAWLYGDWDITSGGMFDDIWSTEYNVVDPFPVPDSWRIFRAFDWGSSAPFCVQWWAESDGSDVALPGGEVRPTLRGDIYCINEWYGWNGTDNKGLKMLASQIAQGITEKELNWGIYRRVERGPADASIYDDVNGSCIAREMSEPVKVGTKLYDGPRFVRSIKTPGSLRNGCELMRNAIYNAQPIDGPRERPGMFVFRHCQDGFLRTVPSIPRDPKDPDVYDSDAEDHCVDVARYVVLSVGNRFATGTTLGMH